VELGLVTVHEHFDLFVEDEVLEGVFDVALLDVAQHDVGVADVVEHVLLDRDVLDQIHHLFEALHLQQRLLLVRLELPDARDEVLLSHRVVEE